MDLNDFAKQVHENAVLHGWWPENRTDAEVLSLIHSEWSEALEAYRNSEPLTWYSCNAQDGHVACEYADCGNWTTDVFDDDMEPIWEKGYCDGSKQRPEGIAVELIDGCIRILDACAAWGIEPDVSTGKLYYTPEWIEKQDLPWLVDYLHYETSCVFASTMYGGRHAHDDKEHVKVHFNYMLATVWVWLQKQGIEPETVMGDKHEFNKKREYRHGGKKI